MAQFKIYGHLAFLQEHSADVSDALHSASVSALGLPEEKRFHRFLPLQPWQFIAPDDRSNKYIIIEIMMFEGRPQSTIKQFFRQVLSNLESKCSIAADDIEIVVTESPRNHWLIRGLPADELSLNYKVDYESSDEA